MPNPQLTPASQPRFHVPFGKDADFQKGVFLGDCSHHTGDSRVDPAAAKTSVCAKFCWFKWVQVAPRSGGSWTRSVADAASGPRCVKTRTRGGTRRRSSSALRCSVTHGGPISAQTAPNPGTGVSCRPHPPVTSRKGLLGHPRAVMGRPLPDRPSDSTTARGEQVRFSRDSGVHARSHSRVADRCTFSDPGPSAGRSAAGGRERVSVQLRATRGFNIHTPPTWKMLSGAPGVLHRCCTRAPTMCKGLLGCTAGTRVLRGAPPICTGAPWVLHRAARGLPRRSRPAATCRPGQPEPRGRVHGRSQPAATSQEGPVLLTRLRLPPSIQ